ncbi:MAG: response regulator transcription factor [Granulosicoccus sp.]|nr:response regulator transcription factor [Granulosicoccus sp.]
MNQAHKILLVEDEEAIRTGLIDVFVYHGYTIDSADTGPEGLRLALTGDYDLILLDIMLPGIDGYQICNSIREQDRHQAIIMLTAKSSDEEIIRGLRLGADDYIAKPFSVAQLVLRVEAVLRRISPQTQDLAVLTLASGVVIDTLNLSGQCDGEELLFTRREMDILKYLAQNSERPVTREELLSRVWGYARHLDIETRTVDIHIAKLRRKIESEPRAPVNLQTVRGAGYRLHVALAH